MEAQPDVRKKKPFAAFFAGLIVLLAIGLRVHDVWIAGRPVWAEIELRGKIFMVEIADTEAKKERGLGKRERLEPDQGMYFPFATANHWVFWMKDMRFPIDMIWIRDGKIVDIDASIPVSKLENLNLETYSPVDPADAVLELNAGAAQAIGARIGDELVLRALP